MKGLKVKNSVDAFGQNIAYGVDTSKRNWDGEYTGPGIPAMRRGAKSIDDVDTEDNNENERHPGGSRALTGRVVRKDHFG